MVSACAERGASGTRGTRPLSSLASVDGNDRDYQTGMEGQRSWPASDEAPLLRGGVRVLGAQLFQTGTVLGWILVEPLRLRAQAVHDLRTEVDGRHVLRRRHGRI